MPTLVKDFAALDYPGHGYTHKLGMLRACRNPYTHSARGTTAPTLDRGFLSAGLSKMPAVPKNPCVRRRDRPSWVTSGTFRPTTCRHEPVAWGDKRPNRKSKTRSNHPAWVAALRRRPCIHKNIGRQPWASSLFLLPHRQTDERGHQDYRIFISHERMPAP